MYLGGARVLPKEDRVNIHTLRHTFASRLSEASGDLLLVPQLGGWSNLALVQRYTHVRARRGGAPAQSPQAPPTVIAARPRKA